MRSTQLKINTVKIKRDEEQNGRAGRQQKIYMYIYKKKEK